MALSRAIESGSGVKSGGEDMLEPSRGGKLVMVRGFQVAPVWLNKL